MDKKSKILVLIIISMVITSAITTYYKYMILRDYEVVEGVQ